MFSSWPCARVARDALIHLLMTWTRTCTVHASKSLSNSKLVARNEKKANPLLGGFPESELTLLHDLLGDLGIHTNRSAVSSCTVLSGLNLMDRALKIKTRDTITITTCIDLMS